MPRAPIVALLLAVAACRQPETTTMDEPAASPTAPTIVATPRVPAVPVPLPSTPGGELARALIAAATSSDAEALEQFLASHLSAQALKAGPLDEWVQYFRGLGGASGGVDVIRCEQRPGSQDITLLVRARNADLYAQVDLRVDERGQLVDASLLPTRNPAEPDDDRLPALAMDEPALRQTIVARVEQLAAADRFSGVVLVTRGERVLVHVAHGHAEASFAAMNRLDTKFNLGSMNKMFTAVAIAQLVEQGKLSFTTTLAEVLPDYPDKQFAAVATVHHLLTHTSGIGGTIFAPAMYEHRDRYKSPADYLPLFTGVAPDFPPGARFAYANPGFMVLGRIIERVSGEPYDAYVQRHIFDVAGMPNTRAYAWDEVTPNLAVGYMRDPDDLFGLLPRRDNVSTLPYSGTSAGGGYSTAPDLRAFVAALCGHRLLGPEMTGTVLGGKVETPNFGPGSRYAYGFIDHPIREQHLYGHPGGAPGINSHLEFLADGSVVVAVLGNHDFPNATAVAGEILELMTAQASP